MLARQKVECASCCVSLLKKAAAFPRAAQNTRAVAHDAPISVHHDIALILRRGRTLVRYQDCDAFCLRVAENFLGRG